jgi:hypothetical protein
VFETGVEILISEGVLFVPTNWTEFSSIKTDGVEEAETEDEFSELTWFAAALAESGIGQGTVGLFEIFLETLWGFHGRFDSVLDDGEWELFVGFGGQPKSKIRFDTFLKLSLTDLLEFWKPRNGQIAVLQKGPSSFLCGLSDHNFCFFTLTLTKGDILILVSSHTD